MIPWGALTEWGGRAAVITGLATPVYGGLAYLQLTPVTESYVTAQIGSVRKDIQAGRIDTLDTKRIVMGLARDRLTAEKQSLEGALKIEKNEVNRSLWGRRIETINRDVETIDRKVHRIDDAIEKMKQQSDE